MANVRHDQPAATWIRDAEDDVAAAQHLLDGGHGRYITYLLHLSVGEPLFPLGGSRAATARI